MARGIGKECTQVKEKYRIVKIFHSATIIITTKCGTVIPGLPSKTIPPLGVAILSTVGTLTAALSVKFNLKKQKLVPWGTDGQLPLIGDF